MIDFLIGRDRFRVFNNKFTRTYALVTRKQDFEIASLRPNDGNT
jgi:hypothetical protein